MKIIHQRDNEFFFFCPGCKCYHSWKVGGDHPRWTWNEDFEKPTVQPSILYPQVRCHLYIREGRIQYLNDCTHALKGQTVDMVEIDF